MESGPSPRSGSHRRVEQVLGSRLVPAKNAPSEVSVFRQSQCLQPPGPDRRSRFREDVSSVAGPRNHFPALKKSFSQPRENSRKQSALTNILDQTTRFDHVGL